jgi:predicted small lipoprotein YifL
MANQSQVRRAATAALVAVPIAVVACGSRGPLDVIVDERQADAGDDGTVVDATPDGPGDGAADAADASDGATDAAPRMDSGLFACGTCVAQSCGQQLFTCLTSSACQQTLTCAVQKCFAGGAPDPQCLYGCANGNTQALGQLIGVFTCIIGNCGTACMGVLGGLGGGPGGGGGGSGGGGGGGGGGG